jgi:hypothetical protein
MQAALAVDGQVPRLAVMGDAPERKTCAETLYKYTNSHNDTYTKRPLSPKKRYPKTPQANNMA